MTDPIRPKSIERFRGALVGLAVGDALGATLEFQPPGSFQPIDDMFGGGPFQLAPGQWTDDTSMALCLAQSLIEKNGFDPRDQLERYTDWWKHGKFSSIGRCFDIGNTCRAALERFLHNPVDYPGSTHPAAAGNGSLMRLAPIPLFFSADPRRAIEFAALGSRTTHAAVEAVDACRYFSGLILGALRDAPRDELIAPSYSPVPGLWDQEPLAPRIAEIAAGSFLKKQPPRIRGTGYVVDSLEASLWAFARGDSFREAVLLAVNLGDDSDTTGAILGQLAGTYYGIESIPHAWRSRITMIDLIVSFADQIHQLSQSQASF